MNSHLKIVIFQVHLTSFLFFKVEKANDFMSETCGFIESDNSELDGKI